MTIAITHVTFAGVGTYTVPAGKVLKILYLNNPGTNAINIDGVDYGPTTQSTTEPYPVSIPVESGSTVELTFGDQDFWGFLTDDTA